MLTQLGLEPPIWAHAVGLGFGLVYLFTLGVVWHAKGYTDWWERIFAGAILVWYYYGLAGTKGMNAFLYLLYGEFGVVYNSLAVGSQHEVVYGLTPDDVEMINQSGYALTAVVTEPRWPWALAIILVLPLLRAAQIIAVAQSIRNANKGSEVQ